MEINFEHQCDVCNLTFSNERGLNRHIGSVHRQSTFKCDKCPKYYSAEKTLLFHKKTKHSIVGIVECDLCKRKFNDILNLNKHKKRVHLALKNHKCSTCDRAFEKLENLKIHIRIVHLKLRPLAC